MDRDRIAGMSSPTTSPESPAQGGSAPSRVSARRINETLRYTCWAVFQRSLRQPGNIDELTSALAQMQPADVVVRGLYDVSAMRADADLMVWLHGPTPESVQSAVRTLRRYGLADAASLTWSAMGLHRPAEFNKGHVPAFMAGEPAQQWLTVYPFVRSYEWYLLPEEERREMLVEHGMMGRQYTGVLSNTVAAFALGDYEWILALEGPELHEIVDLMRHLRASQARRHVRVEVPFFTGRLIEPAEALEVLR